MPVLGSSLAVLGRPDLWVLAFIAFAIRGGLVVLALPILVLPSPIELAAAFGLDAVSISGEPTTRFIVEVAITLLVVAGWLILSAVVGAVVDIVLASEISLAGTAPGEDEAPPRPRAHRLSAELVARLVVARIVTLVPLAVALAWAVRRLIDVGYREVTVPSDTATPLVARIVLGAFDVVVVIVAAWLLTELALAIWTRRLVFRGAGVGGGRGGGERRSRGSALRSSLGRTVGVGGAFAIGIAGSALLLGLAIVASSAAWSRVQFYVREGAGPEGFAAIVVLVLVWAATLVLAGLLSAWRSALVTLAYLWVMGRGDVRAD